MPYALKIKQSALKGTQRLDETNINQVEAADKLIENPHIGKLLKGEHSGLRRIRVGYIASSMKSMRGRF